MTQADSVHSTLPINTSANNELPPEKPQDSIYFKTPCRAPEEALQAIGRLRKEARSEINRLIRFREPHLGSVHGHEWRDQGRWAAGDRRDLELEGAESGIADLKRIA